MPETKPRYTVELTTEGWQIKDNGRGTFVADVWGSKHQAGKTARLANRLSPAECKGSR